MIPFKDFYSLLNENYTPKKKEWLKRKEEARMDKENAPVVFQTEHGSEYRIGESGTIYRQKYSGSNLTSDSISFVDEKTQGEIMKLPSKYEDSVIMMRHHPSKIDFMVDDNVIASFPSVSSPKIGLYPVDSKNGYVHVGHKITHIGNQALSL